MTVKDTILAIIEEEKLYPYPVTEKTNLYEDLGFDSLAFAALIAELEGQFGVSFGIAEMQGLLEVGSLISAVEDKILEGGDAQ